MGWNGSGEATSSAANQPSRRGVPSKLKGVVAGVIIVVVGFAACYFLLSSSSSPAKPAEPVSAPSQIREVQPAIPPKAAEIPAQEPAKPKKVEEALAKLEEPPKPEIKLRELTPEDWERITNRTFKTGAEQLMSWVFTVEPGDMPMPIPPLSKEDRDNLTAILLSPNEIKEADSDMTAFCKEQVAFAKKEMAEYIKQGGDPDEFLQYYFKELKRFGEMRSDALEQLVETKESDPELAEELRKAINKKFEKDEIKPISEEEF